MPNAAATIEDLFVCVGAQKAGTTWLMRMLALHPEMFVTPVKELHYFDHVRGITDHLNNRKRRSRYRKYHQRLWTQPSNFAANKSEWNWWRAYMAKPLDDAWYRSLFQHRGTARFGAEATPEYALLGTEGFAHLHGLAPRVRVLFILRDPRAQVWSQALHHCRANGLDAASQSDDAWRELIASDRFQALSNYAATIEALDATFPHDQIKLMFYEDMHADRAEALDDVCAFIGTAQEMPDASRSALNARVNRSQKAEMPAILQHVLDDQFADTIDRIGNRTGHVPQAWLSR